jgi:hypothetical protein
MVTAVQIAVTVGKKTLLGGGDRDESFVGGWRRELEYWDEMRIE